MKDFKDHSYLKFGDEVQERAWQEIEELNLFRVLSPFSPVLTGTIPIGISLPGSDLDIICETSDFVLFEEKVKDSFGNRPEFSIKNARFQERETLIIKFRGSRFPIEIFAQNMPVIQQYAWRHMMIEYRILEMQDEKFRADILTLKSQGLSTERAFCRLLNLAGDPYQELLDYGERNFS